MKPKSRKIKEAPVKPKAHSTLGHTAGVESQRHALVPIDSKNRRDQESILYQKACHRLEQQTHELKSFEDHEIDAHRHWLEADFSDELQLLQKLQTSLLEKTKLIQEIYDYALCAEVPEFVSYRTIIEAQLNGTVDQLWDSIKERDTKSAKGEGIPDFDRVWDEIEDLAREMFGGFQRDPEREREDDDGHQHESSKGRHTKKAGPAKASIDDSYLKGLYHKLVLQLHPDTNPQQTEEQKTAFHEVQNAYRWRDVHRLEQLYKLVTTSIQGLFQAETAPIGDIISRRKTVEKRLRELAKELKEAKQHPAWGFLKKQKSVKAFAGLVENTRSELKSELQTLHSECAEVKAILDTWEKQSKRALKPRPSKSPQSRGKR